MVEVSIDSQRLDNQEIITTINDMNNGWASVVIVCVLSLVIGFSAGFSAADKTKQTQAIQRGFAEYNSTNGVWQWKESQR